MSSCLVAARDLACFTVLSLPACVLTVSPVEVKTKVGDGRGCLVSSGKVCAAAAAPLVATSACEKGQQWVQALVLLNQRHKIGQTPNIHVYWQASARLMVLCGCMTIIAIAFQYV